MATGGTTAYPNDAIHVHTCITHFSLHAHHFTLLYIPNRYCVMIPDTFTSFILNVKKNYRFLC